MFVNKRDVQIQWGDCDPANIVYYPRYFAMFDDSTSIMFEAAGFSKQDIVHKYGLVGIPMVDTGARFIAPSRFGDAVHIRTAITELGRSSFGVLHTLSRDDAELAEVREKRVWVVRDAAGDIRSAPIPDEVRRALGG